MPGEDKKAARTTIVGGQPPGNERPVSIGSGATIPVGIEELLAMAAVDDRFADELYARPEEAIAASGVQLSATERQILAAVEEAALRQMVANVGGALPEPDRRAFLGRSAAALLALIGGGGALAACPEQRATKGIRPDKPNNKPRRTPEPQPVTGARPDRPDPPRPDPPRPDEPPPPASQPGSIRGRGGARPDRPPKPQPLAGATADPPPTGAKK